MKYYIAEMVCEDRISSHTYARYACVAANDTGQACALLEEDTEKEGGGTHFNVEGVRLREIGAATFEELAFVMPALRADGAQPLAEQELDEALKTVARRLGDNLRKQSVDVKHTQMLKAVSASLGATDWQSLKGKVAAKPKPQWLPKGQRGAEPLRKAEDIEYSARVDALWLTDGDVALAARLLRTDAQQLMASFTDAMDADTAFCGRPVDWTPEHSLARDFGAKAYLQGLGYRLDVKPSSEKRYSVTGYTDKGNDVINLNNHVGGQWHVMGQVSVVGKDFAYARAVLALQEQALRVALELSHQTAASA